MPVKHPFVSAKADSADTTLVRPTNWNADHTLEDGTVGAPGIAFTSDTDTGFFRSAANAFAAVAGGVRALAFATVASAVNWLTAAGSATGNAVTLTVEGSDTNVSVNVVPKGTGRLQAGGVNVPTVSSTDTLTNKTLTSPIINTQLTGTAVGTGASQVAQGSHTTPAMTATVAGHVPTPPNNTTTFLRGDGIFAAPPSGGFDNAVRAYNSADISIANATQTALTFDSERYDTDTMHSTVTNTGRITFTTAGVYNVTFNGVFASNATGFRVASIRLNGTTYLGYMSQNAISGDSTYLNVTTQYKFAATDYVEVVVYQNSGGALNIQVAAQYSPEFSASKVATG